jgi:hypothetical protein
MNSDLAGRIRARLDAIDLNPFAAAKAAGLGSLRGSASDPPRARV